MAVLPLLLPVRFSQLRDSSSVASLHRNGLCRWGSLESLVETSRFCTILLGTNTAVPAIETQVLEYVRRGF